MKNKLKKSLVTAVSIALMLSGLTAGTSINSNAKSKGYVSTVARQTARSAGGYGKTTTGGSHNAKRIIKVNNAKQLRKVLKKMKNRPKVILINKTMAGSQTNASRYIKGTGYSQKAYLRANRPRHVNTKMAKQQERARKKAMNRQKKDIEVDVPSNTTIMGAKNVTIKGINFITKGNNIIFNHLKMINPVDYFPQWDPKDGKLGNFNSQYDSITVKHCNRLWINDCHFTDQPTVDHMATKQTYERQYQQHDGVTDITDQSNHVTISHNVYQDHDKTILIGSSDKNAKDAGKLNVSILKNHFTNDTQRMPRVRYGHVDVSNNVYTSNLKKPYPLEYMIGFGAHATITGHDDQAVVPKMKLSKLVKRVAKDMKHGHKLNLKRFKVNGHDYNIYNRGQKIVDHRIK